MKIAVICNDRMALPALQYLTEEKMLVGIATPEHNTELLEQLGMIALKNFAPIRTIKKKTKNKDLNAWAGPGEADTLWVMTYPWKIPTSVLDRMEYGVFNFHYARLPQYRGPNPIFWQIRNRESVGGISVYRMDEGWDTGPMAFFEEVPIYPEDNYGLASVQMWIGRC